MALEIVLAGLQQRRGLRSMLLAKHTAPSLEREGAACFVPGRQLAGVAAAFDSSRFLRRDGRGLGGVVGQDELAHDPGFGSVDGDQEPGVVGGAADDFQNVPA